VTGEFDQATSDAYHAFIAAHTDAEMAEGIITRRKLRYQQTVAHNPSLVVFEQGWYNRLNALSAAIARL
jgi:hypothetical protein